MMAVMGSAMPGADRSTAVEYTLERVLKDVGDVGSTTAASDLDVRTLGPLDRARIWRDSLGLLGGLCGLDIGAKTVFKRVGARGYEGSESINMNCNKSPWAEDTAGGVCEWSRPVLETSRR